MTIRVAITRRSLSIAVLLIVCLMIAAVTLSLKSKQPEQTQREYYSSHVANLHADVQTINGLIKQDASQSSQSDQIKKYEEGLGHILSTCHEMDGHFDKVKDDPAIQSVKPRIEQVKKLCTDLEKVTEYARNQSEATRDFIGFPSASLTNQESLSHFQSILDQTKPRLEQLRQDPINDPAVSEQLTLLQQLQQITPNDSGDSAKLAELKEKIALHQTNFLNARTYFWKNTIQIDKLQMSLITQQDALK